MTPHRRAAFTLVEVLLAVAIFGTVAAIVGTIFFTGVNVWRTGTAAADAMHHIDAVLEQVTAGLRSAYYPESKEPLYKYGFVQENDGDDMPRCADKISWVKIGPSLVGEDATYVGVPHRVELFLLDEGDGPQGAGLYVRAWRLDGQEDDFDPEEDVDPVLLSSAVTGFDCKMIDRDKEVEVGEDEPFEWLDEWESTNRVPESVLLSLSVDPAPESHLEPLILTRRIEIPLADLSWNPFQAGTSDSDTGRRNRRGSSGNDGGASNAPDIQRNAPSRGLRNSSRSSSSAPSRPSSSPNRPSSSPSRPSSGPTP